MGSVGLKDYRGLCSWATESDMDGGGAGSRVDTWDISAVEEI